MDLDEILFGFDVINPDLHPEDLSRVAGQAREVFRDDHIVRKLFYALIGTKLREWQSSDAVEDRERLHAEIGALAEFRRELQTIIAMDEANRG